MVNNKIPPEIEKTKPMYLTRKKAKDKGIGRKEWKRNFKRFSKNKLKRKRSQLFKGQPLQRHP